ncbi:hypothetical protein [Penaeicola halotolerans]|uniref:hypothetical protein n=1 Tax=Penaeicola halotolerans TaxID=2793196 RepID=UPI001CF88FED|nr:hypothetical protein [Penaeicola halotolerans]
MSKGKKIFLAAAIVFFIIMLYIGYDISTRTRFPGSKGYLKESVLPSDDSTASDSTNTDQK